MVNRGCVKSDQARPDGAQSVSWGPGMCERRMVIGQNIEAHRASRFVAPVAELPGLCCGSGVFAQQIAATARRMRLKTA